MEAIFAVGAATTAARLLVGRSCLVSFAFIGSTFIPAKGVQRLARVCSKVILDSGAFSAWTKGAEIDLSAYCDHIEQHRDRYAWCAALDAIGSAEGSLNNWRRMLETLSIESRSKIVPVFHEGEPIEILDEYVSRSMLVGLGRTTGRRSREHTFAFYDACFNAHPDAKFHAFGNGAPETLEPYPFRSFDCTTWERDASYGGKHGWPWSAASKETRMRAYIEALSTVAHRGTRRQQMTLDELVARPGPVVTLAHAETESNDH